MCLLLLNSSLVRQRRPLHWQFFTRSSTSLSPAWLVSFTSRSSPRLFLSFLPHFLSRLQINTEFGRRVFQIFLVRRLLAPSGLMWLLRTWRRTFESFYNWRCFNAGAIGAKLSHGHRPRLGWRAFGAGVANTLIHMGWSKMRFSMAMHAGSKLLHRLWLEAEGGVTFLAVKVIRLKVNLMSFKILQVTWCLLLTVLRRL